MGAPRNGTEMYTERTSLKMGNYIKRNEIGSFVEMWMDLETVIQSEVSQKEKNKYRILTHVCGI